jgi:hypothetical protein
MTPVQIPFKRNFKDMENKFEYLKIDGREQLPAPWSDYPVLREYETVTVYRNGRDYLDALVGQQDGWWVAGVHMEVGGSGGGFNPGRKWGQFAVLTEGKRMTHHHVCTAHQFGNFIHLTVFYNYSFFHTI